MYQLIIDSRPVVMSNIEDAAGIPQLPVTAGKTFVVFKQETKNPEWVTNTSHIPVSGGCGSERTPEFRYQRATSHSQGENKKRKKYVHWEDQEQYSHDIIPATRPISVSKKSRLNLEGSAKLPQLYRLSLNSV
jgi:hypothetical protein